MLSKFMAPQNNYSSNIKDHWLQVTITNMKMRKLKMWELPKLTHAKWANDGKMALIDLVDVGLPQAFDLVSKKAVSAKLSKLKYACAYLGPQKKQEAYGVCVSKLVIGRTPLMVPWLRLTLSTPGGVGSIPGQGTKILHAVLHSQHKSLKTKISHWKQEGRRWVTRLEFAT